MVVGSLHAVLRPIANDRYQARVVDPWSPHKRILQLSAPKPAHDAYFWGADAGFVHRNRR